MDSYGDAFDAPILPYRDDSHRNSQWTATVRAQLDSAVVKLAARTAS